MLRFCVVAAVPLLFLTTSGTAQTAAELLQKGIYTQQTAGDADSAIQIYRQVIGMVGADRAVTARAQMQLVSAFLQKGDFSVATREFNTLALNYGDQKEVVSAMSTAMRLAQSMQVVGGQAVSWLSPRLTTGTLQNGVYHNTATGTEIRLPAGWSITGDEGPSSMGETVIVRDGSGQSYSAWMRPDSIPAREIDADLQQDLDSRIRQQTMDGVRGSKIRPGTLLKWLAGRSRGLSVVFDLGPDRALQIEYDAWVRSDKTVVYFRGICPASVITSLSKHIQMLEAATVLP